MTLGFSGQSFDKSSNTEFNENPSSGNRAAPCGRTDRHNEANKLIVTLRDFAKSP